MEEMMTKLAGLLDVSTDTVSTIVSKYPELRNQFVWMKVLDEVAAFIGVANLLVIFGVAYCFIWLKVNKEELGTHITDNRKEQLTKAIKRVTIVFWVLCFIFVLLLLGHGFIWIAKPIFMPDAQFIKMILEK